NRRPESYHANGSAFANRDCGDSEPRECSDSVEPVAFHRDGHDRRLVYDGHPRKALVDHFYPVDTTLDDLIGGREVECGDFVAGTYLARIQRGAGCVGLIMERPGRAAGQSIRIRKSIELAAGSSELVVRYAIEDLPRDVCLHFAVEINLAGMAGH